MSENSFTEIENESWFSRIGGALKGIVIGLALFAIAIIVLFWNEGRAVKRARTLSEGGGAVVSVAADKIDAKNNGKLIHVTGKAKAGAKIKDSQFAVTASGLRLRRDVEMYQWKEEKSTKTEKKLGGSKEKVTTYTYKKVWSDTFHKSSKFNQSETYRNPTSMPYEEKTFNASDARLGARTLTPALVSKINTFKTLPIKDVKLPKELSQRAQIVANQIYIPSYPQQHVISANKNSLTTSSHQQVGTSQTPQIGDIRITYKVVKETDVSVIAGQVGKTFEPYFTSSGDSLQLLQVGVVSAKGMIQQAQENNKTMTWILRAVGFVLMLIGLNMMMSIASVLADVIPFLGDIVGAGTGFIAFLIAGVVSSGTIAIAWIFYRPVIGVSLLVVTLGLVAFIFMKVKASKASSTNEQVA